MEIHDRDKLNETKITFTKPDLPAQMFLFDYFCSIGERFGFLSDF